MKKYLVIVIILFLHTEALYCQNKKSITLSGYLTSLQGTMSDSLSGPLRNENLLHNRLNFKGYISKNLTFSAEFRNRLITGDLVRIGKNYSEMIGADEGVVDMSWNVIEKQSLLFNTTVDRLYMDLHSGNFQMTAGRQRINWGQTFIWNPNDIFNAYSFFDFDYFERPGSDAVRLQYFPSYSSVAELAVKVDSDNDITAAGLYRYNKWGYDIQFLAGVVNGEDIVLGTGWSGAIGSTSFRGEASWFDHYRDFPGNAGTLLVTTGFDRIFKDNSTAQVQLMYSNKPLILNDFNNFYSGNLSSKNLAFSRFSAFSQFTWAVSPLLNMTVSAMWFPDLEGFFAGPSLDYSIAENLDFSLLWQHFQGIMEGTSAMLNLGFLRFKYNF
jgi:hypothetical protein